MQSPIVLEQPERVRLLLRQELDLAACGDIFDRLREAPGVKRVHLVFNSQVKSVDVVYNHFDTPRSILRIGGFTRIQFPR